MSIDINPETERVINEELGQGHFQSVDDLILSGVQAWRERNLPPGGAGALHGAPLPGHPHGKEKAREFVEWAKNHPRTPPLSDEAINRASLNPDRW